MDAHCPYCSATGPDDSWLLRHIKTQHSKEHLIIESRCPVCGCELKAQMREHNLVVNIFGIRDIERSWMCSNGEHYGGSFFREGGVWFLIPSTINLRKSGHSGNTDLNEVDGPISSFSPFFGDETGTVKWWLKQNEEKRKAKNLKSALDALGPDETPHGCPEQYESTITKSLTGWRWFEENKEA